MILCRSFLIESIVIGVLGGIAGIILGCASALAIAKVADIKTIITILPIVIAFSFSVGIGLFFGIYPARKQPSSTQSKL